MLGLPENMHRKHGFFSSLVCSHKESVQFEEFTEEFTEKIEFEVCNFQKFPSKIQPLKSFSNWQSHCLSCAGQTFI